VTAKGKYDFLYNIIIFYKESTISDILQVSCIKGNNSVNTAYFCHPFYTDLVYSNEYFPQTLHYDRDIDMKKYVILPFTVPRILIIIPEVIKIMTCNYTQCDSNLLVSTSSLKFLTHPT